MRVSVLLSLSFLSMTFAGAAAAHVDLTYPPARSLGSTHANDLKGGPCGQATNMRTAMVTTFTPGQMVDIKIEEYIDHTGYFAVSFDNDGDNDFPYPRAGSDAVDPDTDAPMTAMPIGDKVLGYHFDKDMNCATQPNKECTIKVQIPNVPCQNCTLQVIQFMYDKTGDGDPNEQYYQCADIKIEGAAGGAGGAGGSGGAGGGTGGAATAGSGGAGGTPGGGAPVTGGVSGSAVGGSSAGTPSGGTGTAGTAPITTTPPVDDGGCSVTRATGQAGGTAALAAGLLVALGWLGRRQKRAR